MLLRLEEQLILLSQKSNQNAVAAQGLYQVAKAGSTGFKASNTNFNSAWRGNECC
jgi:hypothetical protein